MTIIFLLNRHIKNINTFYNQISVTAYIHANTRTISIWNLKDIVNSTTSLSLVFHPFQHQGYHVASKSPSQAATVSIPSHSYHEFYPVFICDHHCVKFHPYMSRPQVWSTDWHWRWWRWPSFKRVCSIQMIENFIMQKDNITKAMTIRTEDLK